ncbi:MAG: hypothetical protein KGZ79_15480 [Dethiobacter sp.]|jgi:LAO/AO transport system kinase|nr:hypothetical protein [Dethiobacter sp.]
MESNELQKIIRANLEDGKLSCDRAHTIAAQYGVRLWEIGKACDEGKIKIRGCQLGCF